MKLSKPVLSLIIDRMLDIWESADQWVQRTSAADRHNNDVAVDSPLATKWCAIGCAQRALLDLGLHEYDEDREFTTLLDNYTAHYTHDEYRQIAQFNDNSQTSFEDMRLMIKCLKDYEPGTL